MGIYLPDTKQLMEEVKGILDRNGYDTGVAFAFNDSTPENYDRDSRGYIELVVPLDNGSRFSFEHRLKAAVEEATCASSHVAVNMALDNERKAAAIEMIKAEMLRQTVMSDFCPPMSFIVDGEELDVDLPDHWDGDTLSLVKLTGVEVPKGAVIIPQDKWSEDFQREVDNSLRPDDLEKHYVGATADWPAINDNVLGFVAEQEGDWDDPMDDVYLNVTVFTLPGPIWRYQTAL